MQINFSTAKLLVALLFLSGTLLHSGESLSNAGFIPPLFLIQAGQFYVYAFYAVAVAAFFIKKSNYSLNLAQGSYIYFGLGYVTLFLISIIYLEDIERYFLLAITTLLVPNAVKIFFGQGKLKIYTDGLVLGALIYVLTSLAIGFFNFNPDGRFSGYMSNPNAFALSTTICLLILLYFLDRGAIFKSLAVAICLYLIYISGSRASTYGSLLAVAVWLWFQLKSKFSPVALLAIILIIFTPTIIALTWLEIEDLGRAFQTKEVFSDSGRDIIYAQAIDLISRNQLTGYGMSAHEDLLGTGNVHSSYLRIFFMVGLPAGIIFFTLYFIGLFRAYLNSPQRGIWRPYALILPLLLIGEDYIVGVGSFYFLSFLLILSIELVERSSNNSFLNDQKYKHN